MTHDLVAWLDQQFENQRHTGQGIKTMAHALPAEAGRLLAETGDFLIADADTKRRILDAYEQTAFGDFARRAALEEAISLLALPHAGRPGYREEWRQ